MAEDVEAHRPESLASWLRHHGPTGPEGPQPLVLHDAQGARVTTLDGRELLDFASGGLLPVGHSHPPLMAPSPKAPRWGIAPGQEHPDRIALLRELAVLVPGSPNRRVMLCDSGREALSMALKLARIRTGRSRIIYLSSSPHEEPDLESSCAAVVVHPFDRRLQSVADSARSSGALVVDDESLLAPGTSGRMFAVEWTDARPDFYVFGRGLAAGLPLGACVTGGARLRWRHESTGGDPMTCRAALAYLDMLRNGLLKEAETTGAYLKDRLDELAGTGPGFEVHGAGLVRTLLFGKPKAETFRALCLKHGLLVRSIANRAVLVCPPIVVERGEVDEALGMMSEALVEMVP